LPIAPAHGFIPGDEWRGNVGAGPDFEIRQRDDERATTLSVAGELDMATAPALETRLSELRADRLQAPRDSRRWVVLDLSRLDFIDSTGVKVLFQAVEFARSGGWRVEIRGELVPQVRQVAELTQLDRFWSAGDA
jgi:anti-anti-sigma factor